MTNHFATTRDKHCAAVPDAEIIPIMQTSEGQDARGAPRPFRLTPSRTVELREGGGWISLFGLPLFLAGIFLTRNVLRVVFRMVAGDGVPSHGWGFLLFVLMSL